MNQQTLSMRLERVAAHNFARARHAVPEDKVQDLARQTRWISELLA